MINPAEAGPARARILVAVSVESDENSSLRDPVGELEERDDEDDHDHEREHVGRSHNRPPGLRQDRGTGRRSSARPARVTAATDRL